MQAMKFRRIFMFVLTYSSFNLKDFIRYNIRE